MPSYPRRTYSPPCCSEKSFVAVSSGFVVAALIAASTFASAVLAHPLEPLVVQLQQLDIGVWEVRWWKASGTAPPPVELRLPDSCYPPRLVAPAPATVVCDPQAFADAQLTFGFSDAPRSEVWVRVRFSDGTERSGLVDPTNAVFPLTQPDLLPRKQLLFTHARLGSLHVLKGVDHLLFLAGLVWLMPSLRALLLATTSFTLGHALALCLTALRLVRFAPVAVELMIAASIVLVGRALWHSVPASPTTRGLFFAAPFGVLHGLGFAGVLQDFGTTHRALVWSLAGFNLGVELAQVFWVVLIAIIGALAVPTRGRSVQQLAGAIIGTAGAALTLERALAFARESGLWH